MNDGLMRYQDYMSLVRRYDRDLLVYGLSQVCLKWDGHPQLDDGTVKDALPWNVAGAAAVAITRGTAGGKTPSRRDVLFIAHEFSRVQTPQQLDGSQDTYGLMLRWAYEQWPYNRISKRDWARCVALFVDTPFPDGYVPEVMVRGWEEALFDTSVETFVSVGVLLWAATNQGSFFPFPWTEQMEGIRDQLGGQNAFDKVVAHNFTTDIDGFKAARREALSRGEYTDGERFVREPFTYNPLLATPLVGGLLTHGWLAPCPPALNLKVSPAGIVYAGMAKWSTAFSRDVGHLFEEYIGSQVRQNEGFSVHPEVTYDKDQKKTIDWFVITPEATYFVECKSVMPSQPIKEGLLTHEDAHDQALAKGVKQLNRTHQLLVDRSPHLAFLPEDRPVIGLLVTLGHFDLVDQDFVKDVLPRPNFPIAIVSADFIEALATTLPDETARLASTAPDFVDGHGFIRANPWVEGLERRDNPMLSVAYEKLTVVAFAQQQGIDTT